MIRYTLTCENDHTFESWFQSGSAYDSLLEAGMVTCTACGSGKVGKTIMAPAIANTAKAPKIVNEPNPDLEKMRTEFESKAEDVGTKFATEARAIHDGDKPERLIYGQAEPQEAKKLIEDGVPILPLPFAPKKQIN